MPRGVSTEDERRKQRLLLYMDEVKRALEEVKVSPSQSTETNACLSLSTCPLDENEVNTITLLQIEAETLSVPEPHPISSQKPHLPKLEIAKFNGDPLKWPEFFDRFQANIGSADIKEADKLSYLLTSVEGEAKDSISGLKIINGNYQVALEILKKRFGKPGLTLDATYKALNNMRTCKNIPKDCRDTFNNIEKHLRILENMGEDIQHNHLRTMITSKFPEEILYELRSKIKVEESTVECIRENLEHIISAKVDVFSKNQDTPDLPVTIEALHIREPKIKEEPRQKNSKRKSQNLHAQSTPAKKPRSSSCAFCGQQHYSDLCQDYPIAKRKEILKTQSLCFKCLGKGHRVKDCKRTKPCYHCKSKYHHSAVCNSREKKTPHNEQGDKPKKPKAITFSATSRSTTTILQTAIVKIQCASGENIKCRALLDTGSQRSYMTQRLANRLGSNATQNETLTVYTFGCDSPKEIESQCTNIIINNVTVRVSVIPYITENVEYPMKTLINTLPPYYANRLADDGSLAKDIDVLIGNDYYHTFVFQQKIHHQRQLYLVESAFGWIVSGVHEDEDAQEPEDLSVLTYVQNSPLLFHTDTSLDDALQQNTAHKLWDLDTLGITDNPKATRDDQAVDYFNKTVDYHAGRYWVKWPWNHDPNELPDNRGLAVGRLISLVKRCDQKTLENYDKTIQDQIEKDIIEVIDDDTISKTHYLPHHHVMKDGKLRIVYDASSKGKGQKSLNECLHRGPALLEDMVGLITQFRCYRYGILADVEKAFLQIGLQETDRDVTRFLWIKEVGKPVTQDNLLHLRFTRVPFGISCSPFLLAVTLKHHLQKIDTPIALKTAKAIYVDNLITGGDSTEECISLYDEVNAIFETVSMNMRQWSSNNDKLQEIIQKEDKGLKGDVKNVLGIFWLSKQDTLSLKPMSCELETANTKRQVLKHVAMFYDPLGFISPILIAPKIFLQQLWKEKLQWDTPLPPELRREWQEIAQDLKNAKNIQIPRWFGLNLPLQQASVQLHCYTDSSAQAYSAVLYLRVEEGKKVGTNLVISKTRLKPLKGNSQNTIPRLELMGVLIGSRLIRFITGQLLSVNIVCQKTYLWTDSKIVLCWLKSTKVLPPFVAARVSEIKKSTPSIEFRYVQTEENPADIATRRCKNLNDTIWFNGPEYLNMEENQWPKEKGESVMITMDTKAIATIQKLQQEHFPKEVAASKEKFKKTDLYRSLGLFLENGILRVKGRFKSINWPEDQEYPILIPKDSEFTDQLIRDTHEKLYHVGVAQTLANIRLTHWIPQGRSKVQKILKNCKPCRKYGGGPYKTPVMAPLPHQRVEFSPPFSYTGTDYIGPLYIETGDKRWICIYTCLAVRAVHLEVVKNLTAEECVMALRRFISTRGAPIQILSDNATCFKLTADILMNEYCVKNNIHWKFIPELAPWFGGIYERLVALVKHCLKRVIDKHTVTESQLLTITKEVEAVLNCRPLVPVGANLEHVLTPADFLRVGGSSLTMEEQTSRSQDPQTDIAGKLVEGWRRGQKILEEFTHQFSHQYLQYLRERSASGKRQRASQVTPNIGDLVQIKDDSPRVKWKTGIICKLIRSIDGEVRVAVVKVGGKEFTRSVSHLYPLEICATEAVQLRQEEHRDEQVVDGQEDRDTGDRQGDMRSVKRKAANRARALIKTWTQNLFCKHNVL